MDDIDRANDEATAQLTASLTQAQQQRETLAAFPTADECVECGDLIPSARQIVMPGCQLCIHCAEKFERTNRGKHNA